MRRLLSPGLVALLFVLAAGLSACDSGDCAPEADCTGGPLIVDGVNLTALFATPSPSEVASVVEAWTPPRRTIEEIETIDFGGRETVTVLRGVGGEGETLFLGAVHQPPRAAGDVRVRPVLVYLTDSREVRVEDVLPTLPVTNRLAREFVTVFVAPRGGTLRAGVRTFATASDAEPLAPIHAQDVLALIQAVRERAPDYGVDPSRLGLIGHGSGGHAALLAGARTEDDDYLLVLAAPTSFVLPEVREAALAYLKGQPVGGFPGLREVLAETVGAVRDGSLSLEQARRQLIERSPAVFLPTLAGARPPAFLFAAYGERDQVVPEAQVKALDPVIRESGGLLLGLPEAGHDSILQDNQVLSTGASFLCARLLAGDPLCV